MTKKPRHPAFRRAHLLIAQAIVTIQKQVKTTGILLFSAKENFLNSQRFSNFSPNTFATKKPIFSVFLIPHSHLQPVLARSVQHGQVHCSHQSELVRAMNVFILVCYCIASYVVY